LKKALFILLFTISLFHHSYSQKRTNFWYFGVLSGVDFNSGSPVAVTNSPIYTNEGTATISDTAGNLLFYTDGMLVWDKNHVQMPNGFGLFGDLSTTQAAIIIPDPGNANLFYIFTIDDEIGDMCYSVVDITLNSGNGDVTIKNNFLMANMTEKLTAVHHCNNNDIWVTAHQFSTNTFVSYLVTSTGINSPVLSSVGTVHTDVHGQMKFSTDGTRIACAVGYQDIVEFFDFDKISGVVTNPFTLSMGHHAYGIEFSPDNTKLYTTYYDSGGPSELAQFDLTAANIPLSKVPLHQEIDPILYGLQLASDGNVYVTMEITPYLSVIDEPNTAGFGCNYINNAVFLDPLGFGLMCMLGLPGFIQSYFNPDYPSIPCNALAVNFQSNDTAICPNTCIDFTDLSLGNPNSWNWTFQGGSPSNVTTQHPTGICYAVPGNYTTTLIISDGTYFDTITKNITVHPDPIANAGADITVASGSTVTLNASGGGTYLWSPSTGLSCTACQNPLVTPTEGINYTVFVTDTNGCTDSDAMSISMEMKCGNVFVPTAFSPNGDSENDLLYVFGDCITSMEFNVFDRWGERVFSSTDRTTGWDGKHKGKELDTNVFVYYLKGTLQNGEEISLHGNISLVK
jgi:gliding motility-associated-like protein